MTRILLLGPNRWPRGTKDPGAGLRLRRSLAAQNQDLDVSWIIMEDDPAPGDPVQKFLALA